MDNVKCPCGEAEYCSDYSVWHISVMFNGGFCVDHYPVEYCPHCGKRFNPDGTTGASYTELEAELAEAKRRAAWYLMLLTQKVEDGCAICKYDNVPANAEPCASCSESYGGKYNFKLAPVPDDFEVKENG